MEVSCGYQMLWNLILIRYQSYEEIQIVIAFPNVSAGADENNSDINNKYYTSYCSAIREKEVVCSFVGRRQIFILRAEEVFMYKTQSICEHRADLFSRMELSLTKLRSYKGI